MRKNLTIALFGESEKGDFETGHFCTNLPQLVDNLGHPPPESQGLHYAVQTLLFEHFLLYFRVREEGFSQKDYYQGLNIMLSNQLCEQITAICIPGAGDKSIVEAVAPVCDSHNLVLIMTEPDLYDYLTA